MSAQFSPQKSILLETSKIAFLQYVTDRKQPLHNYQQRSIFWDREHLHNQNLMLRNKIKQMTDHNTKTKTQLLRSEKQLAEMASKNTQSKILRSSSTHQLGKQKQLSVLKWRVDALRQQQHSKHLLAMKQQIRKLKEQIQKLQTENVQLKKSVKYTRISQLQIQNKELQEQILRLGAMAVSLNQKNAQLYKDFIREKEEMNHKVRKEVEAKAQANRQLKRLKAELQEANLKLKNQVSDKKLLSQISYLQQENSELKEVLEINLKNNSQLKQTLESYIKNNNFHQNESHMTKLEYSASLFSENLLSNHKINNSSNKIGINSDFTSLQLLTPSAILQDFRSPQKPSNLRFQQKIYEVPHYEEEDNRPLVGLQKSTSSVNLQQKYITNYEQIPAKEKDSESQYEYILQDF